MNFERFVALLADMQVTEITLICAILSMIAMVFSWITMATWNWKWYIPTVLFAVASLGLAGYAIFLW